MKLEFQLPAPPTKLGTNHRRRNHYTETNEYEQLAKSIYGAEIRKQLKGLTPFFPYAIVTFTLVVPNFKNADPDNFSGCCKPVLDSITERSGTCPIIPDDSGKYVEVHYRIARSKDKRPAWLLMEVEEAEPMVVEYQPKGIRKVEW